MRYYWLGVIALLLSTLPIAANAAAEARCTALGSGCICSEPLQSTTYGGGIPIPTGTITGYSQWMDLDDSPDATECGGEQMNGSSLVEVKYDTAARPGFILSPASSQPLPSGHSLIRVLGRSAKEDTWVGADWNVNKTPNVTYCQRYYMRFAAGTPVSCNVPPPNPEDPHSGDRQYKDMTFVVGVDGTQTGAGPVQLTSFGYCTGAIQQRFDASAWVGTQPSPSPAVPGANHTDCMNNFCRMEMCLDYRSDGKMKPRAQITTIPPHSNPRVNELRFPDWSLYANQTWIQYGTVNIVHWYHAANPNPTTRYATHAMAAEQRPMNENFWIGSACEVEGGCAGGGGTTTTNRAPVLVNP